MVRRVGFNDSGAGGTSAPTGPLDDVRRGPAGRLRVPRFRLPLPSPAQPGRPSPVALVLIGILGFALVGGAMAIAFAILTLFADAHASVGEDPLRYLLLGVVAIVWLFASRLLGLLVRGMRKAGSRPGPRD